MVVLATMGHFHKTKNKCFVDESLSMTHEHYKLCSIYGEVVDRYRWEAGCIAEQVSFCWSLFDVADCLGVGSGEVYPSWAGML